MNKELSSSSPGTSKAAAKKPSLGLLNLGLKSTTASKPVKQAEKTSPADAITVTPAAAAAILEQLAKRENNTAASGLRIGVKAGGCSGLSYIVQFEDQPRSDDHLIEVDGAKVYVDTKSLAFLAGTEFDYVKTMMKQGFEFRNPKEAGSCGCGESFSV